ncbi:unnamed protein product [Vicia faba]|uniref:Uncharacterized protein n=1 Tax=Vicia faba TaxID=3906 RepID=A0AAV0YP25_VICFA|nr:unnamed protein product [Vicia faba]
MRKHETLPIQQPTPTAQQISRVLEQSYICLLQGKHILLEIIKSRACEAWLKEKGIINEKLRLLHAEASGSKEEKCQGKEIVSNTEVVDLTVEKSGEDVKGIDNVVQLRGRSCEAWLKEKESIDQKLRAIGKHQRECGGKMRGASKVDDRVSMKTGRAIDFTETEEGNNNGTDEINRTNLQVSTFNVEGNVRLMSKTVKMTLTMNSIRRGTLVLNTKL